MRSMKVILPIIMTGILGMSWLSFLKGSISTFSGYSACLKEAELSKENGLYEQAIEFYKMALEYKMDESVFQKISDTYEILYAEEPLAYFRNCYIQDMQTAVENYPKNADFWVKQIELYMEAMNYSSAYDTVLQADLYGANSSELDKLYMELTYMVDVNFNLYYDFKTALNGYIALYDGNKWTVMNEEGEAITSAYNFVGLINDDGKGLYINDIDTRIIDSAEIPRARFDLTVEDAGCYSEESDLLPVKVNGKWIYINSDGESQFKEYEIAGSFINHKAVAFTGEEWILLDEKGNITSLKKYEDIKLNLYGYHVQNDLIIAKENGKYHLYDTEFNRIGDFEADNIDIYIDGLIAFEKDGKWGFVDHEGNIQVEPTYAKAKSFANGYAAVCNETGRWGFINTEFLQVIDYEYLDAFYFNSMQKCLVSQTEESVQLLGFKFE